MVSPTSSRMRRRSSSAICSPEPNRCIEPVTSRKDSSMPNGSTRSVYCRYSSLHLRENFTYSLRCGATSRKSGHFRFACQMVSAVCTPKALAFSFLARMMPWRLSGSPQTAVGPSASDGSSSVSTLAKNELQSQCRMVLSIGHHLLSNECLHCITALYPKKMCLTSGRMRCILYLQARVP